MDTVHRRTTIISRHLHPSSFPNKQPLLNPSPCLKYSPPSDQILFSTQSLRQIMDGHDIDVRDWGFRLIESSSLFCPRRRGDRVFVGPDYNQTKEQQRVMTMRRVDFLMKSGVFEGWLTEEGEAAELRKRALNEVFGLYDSSLMAMPTIQFFLWGGAIKFLGTQRHYDKWLKDTERYLVKGCFAMTELGHGSDIRRMETTATYDKETGEFVINTPCESAQKYWVGGSANNATHAIVFSLLYINGTNEGVHAFIAQIRDADGNICPNVRIADCGHKIGLNGNDNGRIWFDNLRVPQENLLNSVADVLSDGKYVSAIKNPDQRFAAFMAPLTSGRVDVASTAIYSSKQGLAIAVRYALTRRAFSITPDGQEVLLLDYPSHQRRLLPLVAKTCAMSCAINFLKKSYAKRTAETNKIMHVYSSALKATLTWHNMRTLQECREACGGQGLKTENRIGILKGEFDVQSTLEGDNNLLMQQVSKALLAEYIAAQRKKSPFKVLGLEHMNDPCPIISDNLTACSLRSIKFQTDVFYLRERHLLRRFAAEIPQYQAQGESKEKAILLSYRLGEELARAFTERTILQTIIEAEILSSGPVKDVLGLLRSMYALISIEEDSSFLQYGILPPSNFAAAKKEVMKLCSDLRPHALGIVSSFGIPDSFLSPIAFDWVEANSWGSPNSGNC